MTETTVQVETAAEAFLAMLTARGVDYIFANAGTDFASIVEGLARAPRTGARIPTAIAVPHENAAIGMAHGYYLATGKPQTVMTHVNVGTANAICGVINAARDHVPILFAAGRTPLYERDHLGGRSNHIHWAQEMFDQAAMLREMVKWDYELRGADQVQTLVDRALGIAMSEPRGPVYLSLPREVLAEPMDGLTYPTEPRNDTGGASHPNPESIERAAAILAEAKKPLVIVSDAGQHPSTVPVLAEMAERFALPVVEMRARYVNLPASHPMNMGADPGALITEADAILVIDSDVPWIPHFAEPPKGCRVIQMGPDPLFSKIPVRGFAVDCALTAPSRAALPVLAKALEAATAGRENVIDDRRERLRKRHDELREQAAALIESHSTNSPITKPWLSHCVDQIKGNAMVFNEYPLLRNFMTFDEPSTFFALSSAGGLGWGLPAALGAKLAHRDRPVIAAHGDGAYMFANPVACHQVSEAQDLPVLTVVCNNGRWNAVQAATQEVYPTGDASQANRMPLTSLEPTPRFETVVEASGGYGIRVEDPAELVKALDKAMDVVNGEGRQALVNVICQ